MGCVIAVIPARSGSERIPNKNVRIFHDRPMISWSIERARYSKLFDRIIVSTEDEKIANISKSEGAEVPFLRPSNLADNYTGVLPVVRHTLENLHSVSYPITEACLIYATAPFVQIDDLKHGLSILRNKNCNFALSVTTFPSPLQRALRITSSGGVEMIQQDHAETRSQDLQQHYRDAGQFCWGTTQAWLNEQRIFGARTFPVKINHRFVQDIDDQEDWATAEWMYRSFVASGIYE